VGLTLIRKSTGKPRKANPKVALVLAGGAVSGGAFKVGGLKALNDYLVGRGIEDLDMYVGLSAGAVLAVPLASGIGPDEMVRVLEGTSEQFDQLRPIDFYYPNWSEFVGRPARLPTTWRAISRVSRSTSRAASRSCRRSCPKWGPACSGSRPTRSSKRSRCG